jgi:hypothetical protein
VIPRIRLRNHGLATPPFADATAVIEAFGAVQAQDYPGALWGIAQRTKRDTREDVEHAVRERRLVRTWPMRGTLHFVDAALVHSMLRVLTPRVVRRAARRYNFARPAWDELTVGYRDRSDIVEKKHEKAVRGGVLSPVIVIDGEVVGTWTRTGTTIHPRPFAKLFSWR